MLATRDVMRHGGPVLPAARPKGGRRHTMLFALLVPATMQLLGDWNWWAPRAVLRVLPARLGGAH